MKLIYILAFGLLLTACSSIEFAPADFNAKYPTKYSANDVKVYRSEKPEGKYKEIGLAHYKGAGLTAALDAIKKEASSQGGNAVIDIKVIPGGTVGTVVLFE